MLASSLLQWFVQVFISARAPDKAVHDAKSCLIVFCLVLAKTKHATDLHFFLFELLVTVSVQDQVLQLFRKAWLSNSLLKFS